MNDSVFMKAAAILVMAFFYGIYFSKMIAQRRQGIITHQIGRRKEKELHTVETLMSIATFGIVPAQLLSIIFGFNHFPSVVRGIGFFVGMFGDVIFLISVLCMKNSWRAGIPEKDKTTLVTGGIYRFSRNPAFLGFDLMYIGIFMLYGNLLTLGFSVFAIVMLHLQILQEEKYMAATFGEAYLAYKSRVGRYFGGKL